MTDQTIRPELTSLTRRDGDRILVGPDPRPVPTFAAAMIERLCPTGHLTPTGAGNCPRCGTKIARHV